jgi:GDPmannose 4,6-dehydratase
MQNACVEKSALITGITGQDGSYLAELLLDKGYEVHRVVRRTSSSTAWRIEHISDEVNFITGNMKDAYSVRRAFNEAEPDEIYNLAAMSFVGSSWDTPMETSDVNAMGTVRMLEAYRDICPGAKFYQASTSEMFGDVDAVSRNEETKFRPRSPYGVSKMMAHEMTRNYRESFGLDACGGIMFNHESERRGLEFVTRKVTDAVARIHLGQQDSVALGNLNPQRDWGYAPDYVKAMWKMLQQDSGEFEDYVIATGEAHSVEELVETAFSVIGIENWRGYVEEDPEYMRPAEVPKLKGDNSKARSELDWQPETGFEEMIEKMVKADIERNRGQKDTSEQIARKQFT